MEPKLAANVGLSRDTQTDIDRFACPLKSSSGENAQIAECERLHATQTVQEEIRRRRFRNRSENRGAQICVVVRAEQDQVKANAGESPAFAPECPECGYELTGLPDGSCPECGSVFSHAALRAAREERPGDQSFVEYLVTPFLWLVIVISIGCVGPLSAGRQGNVGVLWSLLAGALFAMRSVLFASRVFTLVLIAGAAAVVTLSFDSHTWSLQRGSGQFLNRLFFWSAAICAAALVRLRWRWTLWAWASLLIGMGVGVGATGLAGVGRNEHWSRWPDIRSGGQYAQYPLSTAEAATVGAVAIMVGGFTLLLVRRIEPFSMEDPQKDRSGS